MATPLVSICMPTWNTLAFLEERMETLRAQTCADWELIVIDAFSDDGTWEYLNKFRDDPRIRLLQQPRQGTATAWNECLRRSRAPYVHMEPSDDTCVPTTLESLLAPLQRRPELKISVCNWTEIDEAGRPLPRLRGLARHFLGQWMERPCVRRSELEFLLNAVFTTAWVTMNTVLFRRELLDRVGLFRLELGNFADLDWTLRASLCSDVAYVPGHLVTWRQRSGQHTPKVWSRADYKLAVDLLAATLDDSRAGIPERWKQVTGWRARWLAARRKYYLETFPITRADLKDSPARFLRGCWDALIAEPRWLLRQARRGFRAAGETKLKPIQVARDLIQRFEIPWPPDPVASGW